EAMVEAVDISVRHRRDLHAAEGGQDVGSDLLPIDSLRRWPVAREVVPLESGAEVRNGRRRPVLFLLTDGIGTAVDCALGPLGFLARCSRAQRGKRADGVTALAPIELATVI